jgi:exodeoxyribonuclease-3
MKIYSWNINGIRAALNKGLKKFIADYQPDVLLLQEIKISADARAKTEFDFIDYQEFWHSAQKPGYSGTAVLVKSEKLSSSAKATVDKKVKSYTTGFGKRGDDDEGRVQTLEFDKFYLLNCYFPHANHELTRLDFKIKFNDQLLVYVKKLAKTKPVIIGGDFNVAHQEIDLKNPKENIGNPGFTDEERDWMDKFMDAGFVDTFRNLHKDKIQYSWWSYRFNARPRNIGWRVDYFCISKTMARNLKEAFILDKIQGSDHCPVGIELN